ncbi:MAG: segregation/condensation protein A [Calditrichaeota bacterium]|nr:segregation/condensation protein A [Calditrichota bacterium]
MAYRVKLRNFEGPLDLLLFLIKKNEVDIYDIPMADITRQYLEYVEIMKLLDLEGASEFILLAATLIRIKARMLLPRPEPEDDEDVIDPRLELVTRLLEYKRFKEVAFKLADFEERRGQLYNRGYLEEFQAPEDDGVELGENVNLFTLVSTFKQVLDRLPKVTYHEIADVKISVDEQIDYVLGQLAENKSISFYDLMIQMGDRLRVVVTFIALLELVRRGLIVMRQSVPFGEIWIARKGD